MIRQRTCWRGKALGLVLSALLISGGATLSSFVPTYTPYPTVTPVPPTATATPPRWEVRVLASEAILEFEDFYVSEGATTRMIRVGILYTFNGPGTAEFSPETVLLMNEETPFPGWAKPPIPYRAQASSAVVNFEDDSVLDTLTAGTA